MSGKNLKFLAHAPQNHGPIKLLRNWAETIF